MRNDGSIECVEEVNVYLGILCQSVFGEGEKRHCVRNIMPFVSLSLVSVPRITGTISSFYSSFQTNLVIVTNRQTLQYPCSPPLSHSGPCNIILNLKEDHYRYLALLPFGLRPDHNPNSVYLDYNNININIHHTEH